MDTICVSGAVAVGAVLYITITLLIHGVLLLLLSPVLAVVVVRAFAWRRGRYFINANVAIKAPGFCGTSAPCGSDCKRRWGTT